MSTRGSADGSYVMLLLKTVKIDSPEVTKGEREMENGEKNW